MNLKDTYKKIGLIGTIFERFFHLLKYLPPQILIEERIKHQNRIQELDDKKRQNEIFRRLKLTEIMIFIFISLYILFWFFIYVINANKSLKYISIVILTLRLIDIIQVNVNIAIFDNLKINKKKKSPVFIFSSIRSISLVTLNFIEIAIIFGFLYIFIESGELSSTTTLTNFDKFYFSFVTQLTIGYGDISPKGFFKLLTILQGLLGYLFTILIISRFINLLPKIESENRI